MKQQLYTMKKSDTKRPLEAGSKERTNKKDKNTKQNEK